MQSSHTLSLLICLTGLGSAACFNLDGTGAQPPDADLTDADTTDADLTIIATATSTLDGNDTGGVASFEARATGVSGIVEVDRAPENGPLVRGVRIMTGTSCEAGSEGAVLSDLGDILLRRNEPGEARTCDDHIACGELAVTLSELSVGTDNANDIDGKALIVYSESGDSGTIASCGIIVAE